MNGITCKSLASVTVSTLEFYLYRAEQELSQAKSNRKTKTVVIRSLEQSVARIKTAINHVKKADKVIPLQLRRA